MEEALLSKETKNEGRKNEERRNEETERDEQFSILYDKVEDSICLVGEKYKLDRPLDRETIKQLGEDLDKIVKELNIERNMSASCGDTVAHQIAFFYPKGPNYRQEIFNILSIMEQAGFSLDDKNVIENKNARELAVSRF